MKIEPPIEVLLVEDDLGDVLLIQDAFAEHEMNARLSVVGDGVDALAFLNKEGEFADAPDPELMLLDLNMPRMNGREVLAVVKTDERWRHLPIVVLTTSRSHDDVLGSYRAHPNAFITKPADLHRFIAVVSQIKGFFTETARLPRSADR